MTDLPSGTSTLVFTDIDGSTELVKRLGPRYVEALEEHRDVLRAAFAAHGGAEVDTQGDALFVAFGRARDGVLAAVDAQRALAEHPWRDDVPVRVRIGLHTGEPHRTEHVYAGVAVHRGARICSLAHGGQVLLSRSTAPIVDDEEIPGVSLRDLGEHQLKDLDRPEHVFQLVVEGLRSDFPPLRTIDRQVPLTGPVTIVMAEGRRMMRLVDELPPEQFGALLNELQALLRRVFEDAGGREVEVAGDSAVAAFPSPKQAVVAAVASQRAVATHRWQRRQPAAISVGLHSGDAGVGWIGPAALRCSLLCDVAEEGQIVLSPATAGLLEDENLGELSVHDLGEQPTRRTGELVRLYELVGFSSADTI
jgi:class 3 adenylate cyclase